MLSVWSWIRLSKVDLIDVVLRFEERQKLRYFIRPAKVAVILVKERDVTIHRKLAINSDYQFVGAKAYLVRCLHGQKVFCCCLGTRGVALRRHAAVVRVVQRLAELVVECDPSILRGQSADRRVQPKFVLARPREVDGVDVDVG